MELKYSPYAAVAELNEKGWPSDTRVSEKTLYNWANNYPRRILDAPPRHDIYFLLHFLKQNWGLILYKLPLMIKNRNAPENAAVHTTKDLILLRRRDAPIPSSGPEA